MAELRSYTPSLRDRLAWMVAGGAEKLGAGKHAQQQVASKVGGLIDFIPGVGDIVGFDDAKRDFDAGNYGSAALNAGASTVGLIPGGGDVAAGIAKAIFGGIGAKTANRAALETAEKMAGAGADKADIWRDTGWFKGADDKWRFEIDDSGSRLNHTQVALGGASPRSPNPLPNVLPHDAAYEAYPDMSRITADMRMDVGGIDGTYHSPRTVGNRTVVEGISGTAPTRHDLRSLGLHEMQHAVQEREGFASGGSLTGHSQEDIWEAAKSAYEGSAGDSALLRELGVDVPDEVLKPWDEMSHRERVAWLERGRERLYHRLAGEVEARNVQDRMNMTAAERRARPPWETQDVPFERQIVRQR